MKTSLALTADRHGTVDSDVLAFVDDGLRVAYGTGLVHGLQPVLEVVYRRATLVSDAGGERLTLDTDLEVRLLDGTVVGRTAPGAVLVESKAGGRPGRADRVLHGLGVREASCSKYCVGTVLARPGLPAAPWRPLLSRWFEPVPASGPNRLAA